MFYVRNSFHDGNERLVSSFQAHIHFKLEIQILKKNQKKKINKITHSRTESLGEGSKRTGSLSPLGKF